MEMIFPNSRAKKEAVELNTMERRRWRSGKVLGLEKEANRD